MCEVKYSDAETNETYKDACFLTDELADMVEELSKILDGSEEGYISDFMEPYLKVAAARADEKIVIIFQFLYDTTEGIWRYRKITTLLSKEETTHIVQVLFMMVRREVPACEDLMPAFAIRPMASAVSSAENPSAPAIGAQYLKVSPIMDTFVFALELAAARMSAKCPESLAVRPNAVSASVTISDVVARSSPDAAARFMIPSIPSSMSEVFHPAMAM